MLTCCVSLLSLREAATGAQTSPSQRHTPAWVTPAQRSTTSTIIPHHSTAPHSVSMLLSQLLRNHDLIQLHPSIRILIHTTQHRLHALYSQWARQSITPGCSPLLLLGPGPEAQALPPQGPLSASWAAAGGAGPLGAVAGPAGWFDLAATEGKHCRTGAGP